MFNKIKSISKTKIFAFILIMVGLMVMVNYGFGMFNAYRAMEFARANHFADGNVDPNLIRPWMNIRYVAVAYTVPEEFLFSELAIPMEERNSKVSLDKLNDQFFERQGTRGHLLIMDKLQEAILKYRQNPVPTGLKKNGVRVWMSIQYIANSTGIPPEYIFKKIGISMDSKAYLPLDAIDKEAHYEGGLQALEQAIQQAVDDYQETK